mmetsp:Transcript_1410/g.3367  ORF Transcript_1410/g.3367 Transcript_1410/m.3367 type:complete len:267 (-) Transcript_1410:828-1628(-)
MLGSIRDPANEDAALLRCEFLQENLKDENPIHVQTCDVTQIDQQGDAGLPNGPQPLRVSLSSHEIELAVYLVLEHKIVAFLVRPRILLRDAFLQRLIQLHLYELLACHKCLHLRRRSTHPGCCVAENSALQCRVEARIRAALRYHTSPLEEHWHRMVPNDLISLKFDDHLLPMPQRAGAVPCRDLPYEVEHGYYCANQDADRSIHEHDKEGDEKHEQELLPVQVVDVENFFRVEHAVGHVHQNRSNNRKRKKSEERHEQSSQCCRH